MHNNKSTWSVKQLDHFSQTHFIKSKSKQVNYNFFSEYSFGKRIIIFFSWIEQNHILPSGNFLWRPHLCFEICLNNFSRSMSARSSDKHADSCRHYVCLTKGNGNIQGLSEGSFISFIYINNWIWLYIIDSSDNFISTLCEWNNKSFGNLRVSQLWIQLDLHSQNCHYLLESVLFLCVDAKYHVKFWW